MLPPLGRLKRTLHHLAILVALLVAIAGCAPSPGAPPLPTVATAATRAPSPTAIAGTATPVTPSTITLTWWTPEFLSPDAVQPAGAQIARQLSEFSSSQQGRVRVEPVLKARYGKGGLLDYLLTSNQVAPRVLPDVVALDAAELHQAVSAGLLQPLDGLLSDDLKAGLYPFARRIGEFPEGLLAVQWMADVEHLASMPDQVPTPPALWSDVLAARTPYLFALGVAPTGSSQAPAGSLSLAVLGQYFAAGGMAGQEERGLTLRAEPLRTLLQFYQGADQAGLLPPNALELADGDAVWSVFAQGQVPMAQVSARRFLQGLNTTGDVMFSDSPGWTQPALPVASGWTLAIVTTDPARQEAAAAFISWLLQPDQAGASASAAGWLPTSPGALATWQATSYIDFLNAQLATAASLPAGTDYRQAAARIQQAITSAIMDDAPIDATVETAVNPQK